MKNEVNKFNEAIDELMNGLVKETVCNSESLKYIKQKLKPKKLLRKK